MGKADFVQSSTVKGTLLSTFRSAWVIKGKLSGLADYGFISSPFSNGAGSGLLHIFPGLVELNIIFLWPVPAHTCNAQRLGVTAELGFPSVSREAALETWPAHLVRQVGFHLHFAGSVKKGSQFLILSPLSPMRSATV